MFEQQMNDQAFAQLIHDHDVQHINNDANQVPAAPNTPPVPVPPPVQQPQASPNASPVSVLRRRRYANPEQERFGDISRRIHNPANQIPAAPNTQPEVPPTVQQPESSSQERASPTSPEITIFSTGLLGLRRRSSARISIRMSATAQTNLPITPIRRRRGRAVSPILEIEFENLSSSSSGTSGDSGNHSSPTNTNDQSFIGDDARTYDQEHVPIDFEGPSTSTGITDRHPRRRNQDGSHGECTMCFEVPVSPLGCNNCLQIIGCEECVDIWYRSSSKPSCPLCRRKWARKPDVSKMSVISVRKQSSLRRSKRRITSK